MNKQIHINGFIWYGGEDLTKKLINVTICFAILLSLLSGCHRNGNTNSTNTIKHLTIEYYDKAYGDKWIEEIAQAYKTANPDVSISLKADSRLDQNANSIVESYKNVPDIIFVPNTNWENWASKGYIEDLTSLFNTKVDNNTTLKNKIQPDYLTHCELNGRYWIVPWEDGVAGLLYNVDMFNNNNWSVPATMQDFYNLLPQIKAAGIVPLAWSGDNLGDWKNAINAWWAQTEGRDGMTDYLQMASPEVYHEQGRLDALQLYANLIRDKSLSMDDALQSDQQKARNMFFDSKSAMMLGGSWIKGQMGNSFPENFNIGIMRFPSVDNAKESSINVSVSGGFAAIPSMSKNKDLAKNFLLFMSTDKMLDLYTSVTSSPRPFVYNTTGIKNLDNLGKSVLNIWQTKDNLYMFSSNPLYYSAFSDWPAGGAPLMQIISGTTTPLQAFEDNYNYVANNWNRGSNSSR